MRPVTTTPETPYVETVTVPVEDLIEWPGNARVHDDTALDASVDAHGQYRSVLGRRLPDGRIQLLAGHGTRAALQRRGRATVDVEIRDVPDDDAALRIVLQDNAASDSASYDNPALLALLDAANADGGLVGTGWDQEGYLALLDEVGSENPFDGPSGSEGPSALDSADTTPPPDPVTEIGDVWALGRHRLVCGDSSAVLDPDGVDLVLSDPPYGVSERTDRHSKGRGNLARANDFAPVHDDDKPFDPSWMLAAFPRLILFGGNYFAEHLPTSPSWIVWDKLDGLETEKRAVGFDDNADCELAWTNLGGPARIISHRWKGMIKGSEHGESRVHPTQKPVALMVAIIEWRTAPNAVVADPYGGSGSTLLACEITGRVARLGEISPGYCDVIARRWQELTGELPFNERLGEPVDLVGRDQ